jgi:hypothetical protein
VTKEKLDLKPGPLPLLGAYPVIMIGANDELKRMRSKKE